MTTWMKTKTKKKKKFKTVYIKNYTVNNNRHRSNFHYFFFPLASSKENSYEELVYWSKNDNNDKLNQEQLSLSHSYFVEKSVSFWLYTR